MNTAAEQTVQPDAAGETQEIRTTLGLLHAVGAHGNALTQRGLAIRLGVALGFANALIKRCVNKGLIKVAAVPARRYAYYLTPRGFAEKSRLTAEYVACSLTFFREARRQYDSLLSPLRETGARVVILGGGDLAEIAILAAKESGVEPLCIAVDGQERSSLCGVPVRTLHEALARATVAVLADARSAQEQFDYLTSSLPEMRVLAPPLLNLTGRMTR